MYVQVLRKPTITNSRHCGHMPLFLAVNLGKLTRIIPYNLCLFPAMLRTVKPDDLSNTEGISEGKHIAHLFLVFSAMHLSGNILSNSATPFSTFPRGIEANGRSAIVRDTRTPRPDGNLPCARGIANGSAAMRLIRSSASPAINPRLFSLYIQVYVRIISTRNEE